MPHDKLVSGGKWKAGRRSGTSLRETREREGEAKKGGRKGNGEREKREGGGRARFFLRRSAGCGLQRARRNAECIKKNR